MAKLKKLADKPPKVVLSAKGNGKIKKAKSEKLNYSKSVKTTINSALKHEKEGDVSPKIKKVSLKGKTAPFGFQPNENSSPKNENSTPKNKNQNNKKAEGKSDKVVRNAKPKTVEASAERVPKEAKITQSKIIKKGATAKDSGDSEQNNSSSDNQTGSLLLNPNKSLINERDVKSGVEGLLKLISLNAKPSNDLFEEPESIFLQVCAIKVARCPERILRFPLPNSLLSEDSEICLIVPNVPGVCYKDHEKIIEHYENLLRSKNVKNIKTIMPIHQLATEYDQYELKRRLAELYDFFLVDGKISGKVFHILGKIFRKKKKMPSCVKLDCGNLEENVNLAIRKVPLELHSRGDSFNVQVATSKMKVDEIVENILSVVTALNKQFPGGWANIRCLNIKTALSKVVPIYYTLKDKSTVPLPVVKSKRSKHYEAYEGELSTKLNTDVTVLPSGQVKLKRGNYELLDDIDKEEESSSEIELEDEEDDEEKSQLNGKKLNAADKKTNKKKNIQNGFEVTNEETTDADDVTEARKNSKRKGEVKEVGNKEGKLKTGEGDELKEKEPKKKRKLKITDTNIEELYEKMMRSAVPEPEKKKEEKVGNSKTAEKQKPKKKGKGNKREVNMKENKKEKLNTKENKKENLNTKDKKLNLDTKEGKKQKLKEKIAKKQEDKKDKVKSQQRSNMKKADKKVLLKSVKSKAK